MNYDYQGMGYRIAAERKKQDLTQAQFAEKLGVSAQAVSKWETGAGYPDLSLIPKIATVLNITIDKLFGVDVVPEKELKQQRDEDIPEHLHGMTWVATYGDKVLYASKPEAEIDLPVVNFADGSTADLSSNYIVNKGQQILILEQADIHDLIKEEEEEAEEEPEEEPDEPLALEKAEEKKPVPQQDAAYFNRLALDIRNSVIDCRIIHDPERPYGWALDGDPEVVGKVEAHQIEAYREDDILALRVHGPQHTGLSRFFNFSRRGDVILTVNCPEPKLNELYLVFSGAMDVHCDIPVLSGEVKASGASDLIFSQLEDVTLILSGASDVEIGSGHNLELTVTGASDCNILDYTGGQLKIRLTGAGDISVSGVCDHCSASLTGPGDIDARNFVADTLETTITGPADFIIGRVIGESIEHVQPYGNLRILNRGKD